MNEGKNGEVDYGNYKEEIKNWFFKVSHIVEGKKGFEILKEDIPHERGYIFDYDGDPITQPMRTIKFEDYEIVYDGYTDEVKLYEYGYENGYEDRYEVEMDQKLRLDITYDILKTIYDKHNTFVNKNIDKHRGHVTKELARNFIDPLPGNKEKALKLINDGYVDLVANNLIYYEGLDDEVADKLVEYGYGRAVLEYRHLFKGLKLDEKKANKMVENGEGALVIMYIEYFKGVRLDKKIALRVIEDGDGDFVGEYAEKFEGLDKEVAKKLIETGNGLYVAEKPDSFGGLDEEIEKMLTEKYRWYLAKHKKKS